MLGTGLDYIYLIYVVEGILIILLTISIVPIYFSSDVFNFVFNNKKIKQDFKNSVNRNDNGKGNINRLKDLMPAVYNRNGSPKLVIVLQFVFIILTTHLFIAEMTNDKNQLMSNYEVSKQDTYDLVYGNDSDITKYADLGYKAHKINGVSCVLNYFSKPSCFAIVKEEGNKNILLNIDYDKNDKLFPRTEDELQMKYILLKDNKNGTYTVPKLTIIQSYNEESKINLYAKYSLGKNFTTNKNNYYVKSGSQRVNKDVNSYLNTTKTAIIGMSTKEIYESDIKYLEDKLSDKNIPKKTLEEYKTLLENYMDIYKSFETLNKHNFLYESDSDYAVDKNKISAISNFSYKKNRGNFETFHDYNIQVFK